MASPICVALDSADRAEVQRLAGATAPHAGMFKLGLTAFAAGLGDMAAELAAVRPVFVDLKLHDIPAQVAGAVRALGSTGAAYTTVHALGGAAMVAAAVEAAPPAMNVLAVTVLTSLGPRDLDELGLEGPVEDAVVRLAEGALGAGAHGLVCSPLEVAALRARFGARADGGPVLVVPGVRAGGDASGDQRRTRPAREAVDLGADFVVVGRPITAAPDPAAAAERLLEEVRG